MVLMTHTHCPTIYKGQCHCIPKCFSEPWLIKGRLSTIKGGSGLGAQYVDGAAYSWPEEGTRFIMVADVGIVNTSTITKIIDDTNDRVKFETRNSTYEFTVKGEELT